MFAKMIGPAILVCLALTSSCSSLNSAQNRELKEFRAKNLEVKEKDPTTAAVLNILPGFGDFYNGNPGYGVVNLLLWPASILWAPVGGVSGAEEVNYYASKAYVDDLETRKKKLKSEVELEFAAERISKKEYYIANQKIELLPLTEFSKNFQVKDFIPQMLSPLSDRVPSSDK